MVRTYKPRPSSSLPPKPILPHVIAESIAREILSGAIKPGVVISAGSIADRLGVTRSTAQAGLAVLHNKGLITTRFRQGTTVNHWDQWHLLDPDLLKWAPANSWLAGRARDLFDQLGHANLDTVNPMMSQLFRSLLPCVENRP